MPITLISTNPTTKNKQRKRGWVLNNRGELLPTAWPLQGHRSLFSDWQRHWATLLSTAISAPNKIITYRTSRRLVSPLLGVRAGEGKAFFSPSAPFPLHLHSAPSSPCGEGGLEAQRGKWCSEWQPRPARRRGDKAESWTKTGGAGHRMWEREARGKGPGAPSWGLCTDASYPARK